MILVTGGAGYIGSHLVRRLIELSEPLVIIDNLCSGVREAVPLGAELIVGDVGDKALLDQIFTKYPIRAVIHLAASLDVEESMRLPQLYYSNNFVQSLALVEKCLEKGVKHFVFSSTAAVYGNLEASKDHSSAVSVNEQTPTRPISPYGRSKLAVEWALEDLSRCSKGAFSFMALRYFNVAGAHHAGGLGPVSEKPMPLVRNAARAASGKISELTVNGTDYSTPDGTCVRDYIHVEDLVEAHILALSYLRRGGESEVLNCGYGRGYSVLEVLETMKRVSGQNFPVKIGQRREGDISSIQANPERLKRLLGWTPRFANLETICQHAYLWERNGRK